MKPIKSYRKIWSNKGTCYIQRIRINQKIFDELQDKIQSEIVLKYPRKDEYNYTSCGETFLKSLTIEYGQIVFLNQTQLRFINLFLKLKLSDMNTYLYIKENDR